jgi:23S rRNA pseudouridine1911/1915/1917 synthase
LILRAIRGRAHRCGVPFFAPLYAGGVDLGVIYSDDYLLVADKPPGIVVHPTYKNPSGTLLDALRARVCPTASIVGRLDRLTSGIVVVARSGSMHAALQRAMASSECRKDYLALVYGLVTGSGEIDFKVRIDERDRRRVLASQEDGAPSCTRFESLAREPRAGVSLLRCQLVTGRRHQIRVHLAARGWPIVGDPMYGRPRWTDAEDPACADALRTFPRQALHAWRLALTHPITGTPLRLEARVPRDLMQLLAATIPNPQLLQSSIVAILNPQSSILNGLSCWP